jgi:addiction module RelB/DinJ family antitoxin
MKTTMINIKTDKKVKEEAQKLAEELGFTLSAFVTASLKQFIRTRSVSFSVSYQMTPYLEVIVKEAEEDFKKGRNTSPAFTNGKDMDAYLFGTKKKKMKKTV